MNLFPYYYFFKDYKCGMLYINIDANYYEFKINEKFYDDASYLLF